MTPELHQRAKSIFLDACDLAPPERERFLYEHCAGDAELRAAVDALLAGDARSLNLGGSGVRGQMEGLIAGAGDATIPPDPERIGRYRIIRKLGEGGFGSVYEAEQTEPLRRTVALKVIKLGMDTKHIIARFEAERQSLAMMDHPNIARVFDAGATENGRPYFVMELVAGPHITKFCDERRLDLRARLDLFTAVCNAVQHAHQKGIIHRDLKPSNVPVTVHDDKPRPVVIDFGIARALDDDRDRLSLVTQQGQMIGTLEYMSPEQAGGEQDIDTRTDIYSLGVLLFELLTGSTPVERASLSRAGLMDFQRLIRDQEPPTPSTRVKKLGGKTATVAQERRTDPAALHRMLRGDLDWIVMKALEKDRSRRYETVGAFASDIVRYLNHDTVLARPQSRVYRVRKFARRNRGALAAGIAIAAILIAGIIGTATFAVRAEIARTEAAQRADDLEKVAEFQASQLAGIETALMGINIRRNIVEERRAALEARRLDEGEVRRLLDDLDAALVGVNFTNIALETLDENIFERALKAIDEQFADQPLVKARLLQTVADSLSALGLLDRATVPQTDALEIRRRVLGDQHADTLESVRRLGGLLRQQGSHARAEAYLREALEIKRRVAGTEHPDTIKFMVSMGALLYEQGKVAEAETYYRDALESSRRVLGDEHPDTLATINNLGTMLRAQGRFDEAERHFRQALEGRRRVLGNEHQDTLTSINSLGAVLMSVGRLAEAETYWREALEGRRRVLGDEHPETLVSINNLGALLRDQDKLAEAET